MFLWFGWWACQDVSRRLLNGNMLQILQNADTIISFHSKGKTAVWIQVNIWSELSFNMWNEISEKALNQILCKRWLASAVERDAGCMLSLCHSYCQHMPNTLQYCKIGLPRSIKVISPLSSRVMHYVAFSLIPTLLSSLAHLAHIVHLAQFKLLFCTVNSTSGAARVALGKCTFWWISVSSGLIAANRM